MPISHSNGFRKKIIEEIQEKKQTLPEVADRFRVSSSFVYSLWPRFRETGDYEMKQNKEAEENPLKLIRVVEKKK